MELTIEQFEALDRGEVHLLDMRSEIDMAYGSIPGAAHFDAEAQAPLPPMDGKKLVIYCKRGLLSVDIAERLRDMGYDAYSLKGGYIECRGEHNEKIPPPDVEPLHQGDKGIRVDKARRQDSRVHLRREGLHADGEALSGAGAAQQVPL